MMILMITPCSKMDIFAGASTIIETHDDIFITVLELCEVTNSRRVRTSAGVVRVWNVVFEHLHPFLLRFFEDIYF